MVLGWFERHDKISWIITIIGAVAIFYISTITLGPGTTKTNNLSIIYHFSAFFCFALFLHISSLKGQTRYVVFVLALLIAVIYGITDELHQYFVPGRNSSLFDVGIDSLGIIMASLIYLVSLEYRNR